MTELQTYWNGEPTPVRRVKVIVGKSPAPTWWCADLEGTTRDAIAVDYHGTTFYIDDEPDAWEKLTVGRGSWRYGHSSLPVEREAEPRP